MCYCECFSDICLIILSVLFPPLPVWIRRGVCSCDSLINLLLCFLGYFPGLIHSWYIIAKYPPYQATVYHIYHQSSQHPDLENQLAPRARRRGRRAAEDDDDEQALPAFYSDLIAQSPKATQQPVMPSPPQDPQTTYGAINDNQQSLLHPPAYSEVDNSTRKSF